MDSRPHHSDLAETVPDRRCENCGAELLGAHCYACGQPTKGLVRHFGSILGDFADTVFNVDGRIFRSLQPLLFKPGYLSLEYFAGRRVRYVSPVRLFVFICLLAFLVTRLSVEPADAGGGADVINLGNSDAFAGADSVEEVSRRRDEALGELDRASFAGGELAGGNTAGPDLAGGDEADASSAAPVAAPAAPGERPLTEAEAKNEAAADATSESASESVSASASASAPEPAPNPIKLSFGDHVWDAKTNPIQLGWLPDAGNRRLNLWLGRAVHNIGLLRSDREQRQRMSDVMLDLLPQTLFVLLPLFAVLLKLAYLFKRRLYMEHLIVALHSHAFLSLAILLLALATLTRSLAGEGVISSAVGWLEVALVAWMPLYLLIMQKRVYRQGWLVTLLKYGLLGTAYSVLISFGLTVTALLSLMAM